MFKKKAARWKSECYLLPCWRCVSISASACTFPLNIFHDLFFFCCVRGSSFLAVISGEYREKTMEKTLPLHSSSTTKHCNSCLEHTDPHKLAEHITVKLLERRELADNEARETEDDLQQRSSAGLEQGCPPAHQDALLFVDLLYFMLVCFLVSKSARK